MTRTGFVAVALFLQLANACASAQPERNGLLVTDASTTKYNAPATYVVRKTDARSTERVVGLPGLGEIHVGYNGDDDACRLVTVDVAIYTARDCAERNRGQLCFHAARFTNNNDTFVVSGCADENQLMWSKLEGQQLATVGPSAFRQRCAKLPRRKCDLVYLGKTKVSVATNDAADQGFAFAWDGDGWRACFLEKEAGAYEVDLDVEDACGHEGKMKLSGNSADLDD
jgi:hypothetical protein